MEFSFSVQFSQQFCSFSNTMMPQQTSSIVTIRGLAQRKYDSVSRLIDESLETFYTDRGLSDSHLIPPITFCSPFRPRNVDDRDPRRHVSTILDRASEKYGTDRSFFTFRGFDIRRIANEASRVFPNLPKFDYPKYDFFLFGREIGFVLIQVSNLSFRREQGHFELGNSTLPEGIEKSLSQLQDGDRMIAELLSTISKLDRSKPLEVRKILLTPKLDRTRYREWTLSLDKDQAARIGSIFRDVTQWFGDDSIEEMLEREFKSQNGGKPDLNGEIYEKLGSTLIAWMSLIRLDKFDDKEVRSRSSGRPFMEIGSSDESSKEAKEEEMFFLTPEQTEIVHGPRCQLIYGGAGTGKTTALQALIRGDLSDNRSVLIVAPKRIAQGYESFLNNHDGSKNYLVFPHPIEESTSINSDIFGALRSLKDFANILGDQLSKLSSLANDEEEGEMIAEHFRKALIEKYGPLNGWLEPMLKFDRVIIDDAFDEKDGSYHSWILACLILVEFVKKFHRNKSILIATDPYRKFGESAAFGRGRCSVDFEKVVRGVIDFGEPSVTVLKRFVRGSKEIYDHTFDRYGSIDKCQEKGSIDLYATPIGAEQIDRPIASISDHRHHSKDAIDRMWQMIQTELDNPPDRNHNRTTTDKRVAIILAGSFYAYPAMRLQMRMFDPFLLADELYKKANVHDWDEVSSLEWPVVIFATCAKRGESSKLLDYQKYQGFSRATERLVEITVTYDQFYVGEETRERTYCCKEKEDTTNCCVFQPIIRGCLNLETFLWRCFRRSHKRMR